MGCTRQEGAEEEQDVKRGLERGWTGGAKAMGIDCGRWQ